MEDGYEVTLHSTLVFNVTPITPAMIKLMVTSALRDGVSNIEQLAEQVRRDLEEQGAVIEEEENAGSK